MGVFLTDEKIAELLTEPKQCDGALLHKLVRGMKHKKGAWCGLYGESCPREPFFLREAGNFMSSPAKA